MSVENPSFENKSESKKDWKAWVDEGAEKERQAKRSQMTPKELAEDDRSREEYERDKRHYDNLRKAKTGTQEEKTQAEKELSEASEKLSKKFEMDIEEMWAQKEAMIRKMYDRSIKEKEKILGRKLLKPEWEEENQGLKKDLERLEQHRKKNQLK